MRPQLQLRRVPKRVDPIKSRLTLSIDMSIDIAIDNSSRGMDQIVTFFIFCTFSSSSAKALLFCSGLLQYYLSLLSVSLTSWSSCWHFPNSKFLAKVWIRSEHRAVAFLIATKLGSTKLELGRTCAAYLMGLSLSGSVYQL